MSVVKADPAKPYKAIVSAVLAGLAVLGQYSEVLPVWATVLIAVAAAGLLTYQVENPTTTTLSTPRNDIGAATGNTLWFVLGVIGLVLIVLLVVGVI